MQLQLTRGRDGACALLQRNLCSSTCLYPWMIESETQSQLQLHHDLQTSRKARLHVTQRLAQLLCPDARLQHRPVV